MHTPHPREACYFGIKWVSHSIFPFPLFLERQVPVPAHGAGSRHAVSLHTALGSQHPGEHCCSLLPSGISLVKSPPSRLLSPSLGSPGRELLVVFSCSSTTSGDDLRDATGPAPAPNVLRGGSRIWPWMQEGAHQCKGLPWALACLRNHRMQPAHCHRQGGEEMGWLWGICSHKGHGQSGIKGRHFPPHPDLFPSQN